MSGVKTANNHYFNSTRVHQALERLVPYDNQIVKGSVNNRVRISQIVTRAITKQEKQSPSEQLDFSCKIHNKCWLEWATPEDNTRKPAGTKKKRAVKRIGYWGQIWALGILWSLVSQEKGRKPFKIEELAQEILAHGEKFGIAPAVKYYDDDIWKHEYYTVVSKIEKEHLLRTKAIPETREKLLEVLLFRGKNVSIIPPIKTTKALHRCVAAFVHYHLTQSEVFCPKRDQTLEAILTYLANSIHKSVEDCFWGLTELLGIKEDVNRREADERTTPEQKGLTWIDPSVWKYMTSPVSDKINDPPPDVENHVRKVREIISYQGEPFDDQAPLVILHGPAHSGKKSVIGDFFKKLKSECSSTDIIFQCKNRDDDEIVPLPILCIQTRDRDYISLCIEVLVFLERVRDQRAGKTPHSQQDAFLAHRNELNQLGAAPSVRSLLENIRELHTENPVLFVFMDVRQTSFADIRFLIRRHGIRRLLETLLDSCSESRFFLSMDAVDQYLKAYNLEARKLEHPTCSRIRWYLNDSQTADFENLIDENNYDGFKANKIEGRVLMTLSILFSQKDVVPAEFFALFKGARIGAAGTADKGMDLVCSRLLQSWNDEGLLPYIALVVASDDGVMPSTLKACISDWQEFDTTLNAVPVDKGLQRFKEISELGRELFFKRKEPPDFIVEEVRFDEPQPSQQRDFFKTWMFEGLFSSVFRKLFFETEEYRETMRIAYRLVAGQARSRARYQQLKNAHVQPGIGQWLQERSVQTYVALLLSLDPNPKNKAEKDKQANPDLTPLVLATPKVFSLDSSFDHKSAIKYAYHILLKAEADRDNRLSMSLDTDFLRLQLYILLCAAPGTVGLWKSNFNRNKLPNELAQNNLDHLNIFTVPRRAEILVSVALTAFYTGHYAILSWAEENLRLLYESDISIIEPLSRVIAARIDIECQLGCPLNRHANILDKKSGRTVQRSRKFGSPNTKKDLKSVQDDLEKDMQGFFAQLRKQPEQASDPNITSPETLSAFLRLQARAVYLECLRGNSPDVSSEINEFHKQENTYLHAAEKTSAFSQQGRTGRLFMKVRLRHFPMLCLRSGLQWESPMEQELLDRMKVMIHANVSRLSKFSGSERVQTIADHASHLLMQGKVSAALNAIFEARRVCFQGTSSDSIRLEVLKLETMILLADAELRFTKSELSHEEAQIALDAILLNLRFMYGLIEAYELQIERLYRNILIWRTQKLIREFDLDCEDFSEEIPLEEAIDLAEDHGAFGLKKQIERLRDHFS